MPNEMRVEALKEAEGAVEFTRLQASGETGLDLSPGCLSCKWATGEIKRLRTVVFTLQAENSALKTPPKHLADQYDAAVDKAYSVGALKQLRNAELAIARWYIDKIYSKKAGSR